MFETAKNSSVGVIIVPKKQQIIILKIIMSTRVCETYHEWNQCDKIFSSLMLLQVMGQSSSLVASYDVQVSHESIPVPSLGMARYSIATTSNELLHSIQTAVIVIIRNKNETTKNIID